MCDSHARYLLISIKLLQNPRIYSYLNHCLINLGNLIYIFRQTVIFSSGSGSSGPICLFCDFGRNNSSLIWIQVYSSVKQARWSWMVLPIFITVSLCVFKPVEGTQKIQKHKTCGKLGLQWTVLVDNFHCPYFLVEAVEKGGSHL